MSGPANGTNGSDNVVSLTPWDIAVRSASQRRAAKDLLKREEADQIIRGMGALEAYYTIKALGPDDATPLLAVIEPEQVGALIDLESWQGDRLATDDVLIWLEAFREAGPEALRQAGRAMDSEALALLLRRRLLIALAPLDDDGDHEAPPDWVENPPEEIQPVVRTPDQRFFIAARTTDESAEFDGEPTEIDEEDRKAVLRLVDDLYRDEDFEFISSVLRVAESGLSSELEEHAFRFRNARLEDLGFPSYARAIGIYAPLDPDATLADAGGHADPTSLRLPALHAGALSGGVFHASLQAVEDPVLVRTIESELLPLANAALIADRVEPGNIEGVREALLRMRSYIELALAHGAPASERVDAGRKRFESHSVRTLFSVGYALTLQLGTRARKLKSGGDFAMGDDALGLLDDRDRAIIDALLSRRPLYSTALDDAPEPATRGFSSPEDLDATRVALGGLEALGALSRRFDLKAAQIDPDDDVEPPHAERSLDVLLSTLVANILVDAEAPKDGARRVRALDRPGLAQLAALTTSDDFVDAGLPRVLDGLEAGADRAALTSRVSAVMDTLRDTLAPLAGGAIDTRFVGGLLLRRAG